MGTINAINDTELPPYLTKAVPVPVANGGTGIATTTAYGLIAGGTTATGNFQNASTGTSGQLYVSGGSASLGTWTSATGTGNIVKATSPTVTGLTSDQITWSNTTKGIVGTTTNDNAASGYVGEVISSTVLFGSAISLSNNTNADLTSISLTAGDWDVNGNLSFTSSSNTITGAFGWISLSSATKPDGFNINGLAPAGALLSNVNFSVPFFRVSTNSTVTVYISGYATFASGSATLCGQILARRRR